MQGRVVRVEVIRAEVVRAKVTQSGVLQSSLASRRVLPKNASSVACIGYIMITALARKTHHFNQDGS